MPVILKCKEMMCWLPEWRFRGRSCANSAKFSTLLNQILLTMFIVYGLSNHHYTPGMFINIFINVLELIPLVLCWLTGSLERPVCLSLLIPPVSAPPLLVFVDLVHVLIAAESRLSPTITENVLAVKFMSIWACWYCLPGGCQMFFECWREIKRRGHLLQVDFAAFWASSGHFLWNISTPSSSWHHTHLFWWLSSKSSYSWCRITLWLAVSTTN